MEEKKENTEKVKLKIKKEDANKEKDNKMQQIVIQNQMSEEERKKIDFRIFINLLLAITTFIYFFLINLGYKNIARENFILDLQVFSITLLTISIVLFEQSYKKEEGKFCLYGIEMLVLAIVTLFMPYIYFYSGTPVRTICSSLAIFLSIYYVGKCIVIQNKAKKRHLDNLSDVKEIIKK